MFKKVSQTINVRFLAFGQAAYNNRMQQSCNKTVENTFGVMRESEKLAVAKNPDLDAASDCPYLLSVTLIDLQL